jgi:hypothetical protein
VLSLRPLGSTVITRFAATMGRSDSRTGVTANYLFSAVADLPCHPVGLCGSLMLLNGLSDRAVLFHPGEPAACF